MGQNMLPLKSAVLLKSYREALPPDLLAGLRKVGNSPVCGDPGCPCIWFDRRRNRCTHYEHRPPACKFAVQPGDKVCMAHRNAQADLIAEAAEKVKIIMAHPTMTDIEVNLMMQDAEDAK